MKKEVVVLIVIILVFKFVAGLPQHADLTFNKDDTFCIDIWYSNKRKF